MADDTDDELFLTPPSSPTIQPFEGNESLELAQWKLDVLCRTYDKVNARKKDLELEEKRTLALLSKVSLKLQKSSRSSNEQRVKLDDHSLLGVKTKPAIAKKNPPRSQQSTNTAHINSKPVEIRRQTSSTRSEQRKSTPLSSTTSQPNEYLPVLVSPVEVRRLPPYDHNHLARRIECSQQADALYKQLERHMDIQNERPRRQQQQTDDIASTIAGPSSHTTTVSSKLSLNTPPDSIVNTPKFPAVTPHGSSTSAPHPASYHSTQSPPTTQFFQNQLPSIWPHQTGYMPDQQYPNYANSNRSYYQAHGSQASYYGHHYQSMDSSWSGWNQSYVMPNQQNHPSPPAGRTTNNQWVSNLTPYPTPSATYPPSSPPVNPQTRTTPQQTLKHIYANHAPTPASDNTINLSSQRPAIAQKPQRTGLANAPPPPPTAAVEVKRATTPTLAIDDKHRGDHLGQPEKILPSSIKISKPSTQYKSKNTTASSSNNTLKMQIYQSPLETFGIHPEQSTKPTQGSKRLDKPLCVFEAEGGTCNDDTCRSMHFRDF